MEVFHLQTFLPSLTHSIQLQMWTGALYAPSFTCVFGLGIERKLLQINDIQDQSEEINPLVPLSFNSILVLVFYFKEGGLEEKCGDTVGIRFVMTDPCAHRIGK
jgi:hypothetical protein